MVAWCDDCARYINQYCDTCGRNFGTTICEVYACGGTMMCPICKGKNLRAKKEFGPDPYDFTRRAREKEKIAALPTGRIKCPSCGFKIEGSWKFCPECGIKFKIR
jgi:membrane protease subunit (stomatin/prohibitin family)